MLFAAFRSALAGGVFLPANFLARVGYGTAAAAISSDMRTSKNIDSMPIPRTPEEIGITKRQLDVLTLLVQGMPNKRIATTLDISVQVVKKHVSDLLAHFKVMSRTQLVIQIAQRGLIFGPPGESNPIDEVTQNESLC